MASPIVKGQAFGTTETVTAAKLQNIVDNAAFKDFDGSTEVFNVSGSTDIGTCVLAGGLAVKTSTGQLQLKSQADQTVIGNVSGGAAVPTAVPIVGTSGVLKNDDALGTSDTQGATQGNIKAYADGGDIGVGQTWQSVTRALDGTSYTNSTGKPIMVKGQFTTSGVSAHTVTITVTPSGGSAIAMTFAMDSSSGGTAVSNGSIIIPNNTSYKFTANNVPNNFQFYELR